MHTDSHGNHAAQATTIACMCMHTHMVPIAIFAQSMFAQSISAMSGDANALFSDMKSCRSAQMPPDASSDESELEGMIHQLVGPKEARQVKRLKDNHKKLKQKHDASMKLVHHWKDRCLALQAEHKQLGSEHNELKAKFETLGNENLALKDQHERLGNWLSQSTGPTYFKKRSKGSGSTRSEEPQFQESRPQVCANISAYPKQPKTTSPAKVFPIGATLKF